MPKFRKKPVVIEAMRYPGHGVEFADELIALGEWADEAKENFRFRGDRLIIKTLEGDMIAERGDWIIRGVHGEFYPCKPDIFEKTYEPVREFEDELMQAGLESIEHQTPDWMAIADRGRR